MLNKDHDNAALKRKLDASQQIQGLDGASISDFWSWAYSDMTGNTVRSIFAEYIVGSSLGLVSTPRIEWAGVDFVWQGKKIEVKSGAYLQSWPQKELSSIRFDISIRKQSWDPETGIVSEVNERQADCYVFCLHAEKNESKVDVADLRQWRFYVMPTRVINEKLGDGRTASLRFIEEQTERVEYSKLSERIKETLSR